MENKPDDQLPADATAPLLDHNFDGIQEYDNPMPGWWKWLFLGTIVFSLLYWPYYHFGAPGRSVEDQYSVALAENMRLQFAELGDIKADEPTLLRLMHDPGWVAFGQSLYRANCAACHGIDGGGIVGPNLTDDAYKSVRVPIDLLTIIQNGAGSGAMPAWNGRLNLNEQMLVAAYVATLRGAECSNPKGPEGTEIPPWPQYDPAADPQATAADPQVSGT